MSASTMPTVQPAAASAIARLTVTDDLPTPPLPRGDREHLGQRVRLGERDLPAGLAAAQRGLRAPARCSSVITPRATFTALTPATAETALR